MYTSPDRQLVFKSCRQRRFCVCVCACVCVCVCEWVGVCMCVCTICQHVASMCEIRSERLRGRLEAKRIEPDNGLASCIIILGIY